MKANPQHRQHSTLICRKARGRQRGALRLGLRAALKHTWRALTVAFVLWPVVLGLGTPCLAQNAKLQQAPGGIAFSGNNSPFSAGFGNVNGLGIGTPATGLTKIAVSGGEFYYTPYTITVNGAGGGNPALVKAYISSSFGSSSSVLQLMSCPYPNPCTAYSSYTALSTSIETAVLPNQSTNGNYTAYLGLFVGNTNGGVTSPDSVQVTFHIYDGNNNHLKNTAILNLNNPSVTVETVVQLQLGTAASGLAVTATGGSPDFTTAFGNVNGLGIGAGAGLTIVAGQVSGGSLYSTPYVIQPVFSGFNTTSGTVVNAYVNTNFAHSTILNLYDSGSSGSGYGLISTSSGSPTPISSSVNSGSSITRYLGLFVSNVNGAGSFRGNDSATITYTLLVQ